MCPQSERAIIHSIRLALPDSQNLTVYKVDRTLELREAAQLGRGYIACKWQKQGRLETTLEGQRASMTSIFIFPKAKADAELASRGGGWMLCLPAGAPGQSTWNLKEPTRGRCPQVRGPFAFRVMDAFENWAKVRDRTGLSSGGRSKCMYI